MRHVWQSHGGAALDLKARACVRLWYVEVVKTQELSMAYKQSVNARGLRPTVRNAVESFLHGLALWKAAKDSTGRYHQSIV